MLKQSSVQVDDDDYLRDHDQVYLEMFAGNQSPLNSLRSFWGKRHFNDGKNYCCKKHWIQWQMWCIVPVATVSALKTRTIMYYAINASSAIAVCACPNGMLARPA